METLLTAFGDNDLTYTSIFLSTYRAFASTQAVLELLLDRYLLTRVCQSEHNVSDDLDLETIEIAERVFRHSDTKKNCGSFYCFLLHISSP